MSQQNATFKNENYSKIGIYITYAYIMVPFFIFAIGWFGKRFWIPIILILAVCYWKAVKESDKFWIPEFSKDNMIKILFIIFVVFLWVYYSGIGRLVFQNTDHNCRNAIYEVLVRSDWPIYNYDVKPELVSEGVNATSLIYYIGFWLPSAVIGKAFGIDAGYGFQVFWAILGILLVYYFLCTRKKQLLVWPLAVLIFFSGLDIVGRYLMWGNSPDIPPMEHLEWWVTPYQYSSMTTQLFWVFNQAIPAWLCTVVAFMQKNNRSIVLILACCMLSGTFPFIGLLALVLFWMFDRKYPVSGTTAAEKIKAYIFQFVRDSFTFQNLFGGGIIGIFSFLYLRANIAGGSFMQQSSFGLPYNNHLAKYLPFVLLEVGVYFLVLFKYNRTNKLYWFLLVNLLVIPPIKVGNSGDFCMRVSIPALFMLMLLTIDGIMRARQEKNKYILCAVITLLVIGSITPIHEITRTLTNTRERLYTGTQLYETPVTDYELLNADNFSGSTENSFFFKYIAR